MVNGIFRTHAWSADFNPHNVQPSTAWIRIHGLALRPNTSDVEKPLEGSAVDGSKIVVEIDPLIDGILRSKKDRTYMFVGDVLNHEKEISFIFVEAIPVYVQDTSSSSGMTSPIVGDVMNLAKEVSCEELHEEEEVWLLTQLL
ncbi:hypothetical protein L195_g017274 [Trifolium pratense]|uniref:DUF4283 domain-containing protein n=1 Tax=Trifolium pratense TaxID=57577 RepID=A0A2K3MTJ8_TRIPR|nr:hypothetical protein L195_g017274 [Trifolium pratense]